MKTARFTLSLRRLPEGGATLTRLGWRGQDRTPDAQDPVPPIALVLDPLGFRAGLLPGEKLETLETLEGPIPVPGGEITLALPQYRHGGAITIAGNIKYT